jgi:hypothetical protein
MRPVGKLAAFAAVVALAFGSGAAIGAAVGPIDVNGKDAEHQVPRPSPDARPHGD